MSNIVASSGYKDIFETPLNNGKIYAGTIVDRNIENDMLHHITNTTVLSDLTKCGQVIQFNKPPRVGPWRPYELNQEMIPDQPVSDSFCLSICGSAYKSIKIDQDNIRRACDYWEEFERGFMLDAWHNLSILWHIEALTGMQIHTSSRNMGTYAGRNRNLNLGTIGTPLNITPDNVAGFFTRLRDTLSDAGRWYDGEMFVLVPRALTSFLIETMFAKQLCCNTGDYVLFKGMQARDILGFTVIETDYIQPILDPATRKLVYPIIAGWNEAYAFTGDIVYAKLRDAPGNTAGIVYNMISVYGGGAIYPDGLAKAYITLSTDGLVRP